LVIGGRSLAPTSLRQTWVGVLHFQQRIPGLTPEPVLAALGAD
jgi:hypothetical protein